MARHPHPSRSRLRDHALALWLVALGLLGVARFVMRALGDAAGPDPVAWVYLLGGILVTVLGIRAWRRPPPG